MKTHHSWMATVLAAGACLALAGCSTPEGAAGKPRRFHEAERVDAVLQFCSWEYTFLVQPRYEDQGFLEPIRRDNIGRVFDELHVRRDLAVVVIGWTYGTADVNQLVPEWKSILGACGFQRVVFLRPNHDKLNGSLILEDSTASLALVRTTVPYLLAGQ